MRNDLLSMSDARKIVAQKSNKPVEQIKNQEVLDSGYFVVIKRPDPGVKSSQWELKKKH